jgi:hypothetical protein
VSKLKIVKFIEYDELLVRHDRLQPVYTGLQRLSM